jgi:hypothetical protein
MINAASQAAAIVQSAFGEDNFDWLCHSRAIDQLWRPAQTKDELDERGLSCGPVAFAALAQLQLETALLLFPEVRQQPWINRVMMERALRAVGYDYVRASNTWPLFGLCLLHFTGPWTQRGYPAAILQNTHWVAVFGEYVFDINWNGWLPRSNWEEVIIENLLAQKALADGWTVMTSYEVQSVPTSQFPSWLCIAGVGAARAAAPR